MNTRTRHSSGRRGSAIVIVLAVLVLMLAFMAGNNVTLRSLHREVQLIEKRQRHKYEGTRPSPATNRVDAARSPGSDPGASQPGSVRADAETP